MCFYENANTAWFNLYYGIETIALDTAKQIEYDGDNWVKVAFISSFDEYKMIFDTTFDYSAYSDYIYPALEHNMREENGELYHCKNRVGGGGTPQPIIPLDINVIQKDADEIVLRVNAKEAGTAIENEDGVLFSPDIDSTYTIINQDGYWVLKSFYGEE